VYKILLKKELALLISYFCLVINNFRCRLESSLLERTSGIELYIFLMTFLNYAFAAMSSTLLLFKGRLHSESGRLNGVYLYINSGI